MSIWTRKRYCIHQGFLVSSAYRECCISSYTFVNDTPSKKCAQPHFWQKSYLNATMHSKINIQTYQKAMICLIYSPFYNKVPTTFRYGCLEICLSIWKICTSGRISSFPSLLTDFVSPLICYRSWSGWLHQLLCIWWC